MMISCNPPRDESASSFPFEHPRSHVMPGAPTRSCNGRSTKSMIVRTLMPRIAAATAEPMVATYWISPASSTLTLSDAGMTTISAFKPFLLKEAVISRNEKRHGGDRGRGQADLDVLGLS